MSSEPRNGLTTIAFGYGLPETLVLISFLEAHGVRTVATPVEHARIFWELMTAVGGIAIQIERRQLDEVRALLDTVEPVERRPICSPIRRLGRLAFNWAGVWCGVPPPARGVYLSDRIAKGAA